MTTRAELVMAFPRQTLFNAEAEEENRIEKSQLHK